MSNKLTLTVVTICFNNREELQRTMQSVLGQERLPDEYWIIDGSTTSEIRDYLTLQNLPPFVKWISEPDKGISDALNKGISRATSDVVHLLHSADTYFHTGVTAEVMKIFDSNQQINWVHGKYKQFIGGNWVITGAAFQPEKLHLGMRKVSHPTMFVKRSLYELHGLFSIEKKLAMDYDFIVRIRKEPFEYLPKTLVVFAPDGASNVHWKAAFKEVMDSYKRYVGNSPLIWLGYFKQQLFYTIIHTRLGNKLLSLFKVKN